MNFREKRNKSSFILCLCVLTSQSRKLPRKFLSKAQMIRNFLKGSINFCINLIFVPKKIDECGGDVLHVVGTVHLPRYGTLQDVQTVLQP